MWLAGDQFLIQTTQQENTDLIHTHCVTQILNMMVKPPLGVVEFPLQQAMTHFANY